MCVCLYVRMYIWFLEVNSIMLLYLDICGPSNSARGFQRGASRQAERMTSSTWLAFCHVSSRERISHSLGSRRVC